MDFIALKQTTRMKEKMYTDQKRKFQDRAGIQKQELHILAEKPAEITKNLIGKKPKQHLHLIF